jgi:hypothetical protein
MTSYTEDSIRVRTVMGAVGRQGAIAIASPAHYNDLIM